LAASASYLQTAIDQYTAAPKTYADCVDLICHSKGGLAARTYLALYDPNAFVVRHLIVAGTPQAGSAEIYQSPLTTKVIRELAPIDPWYRKLKRHTTIAPFEIPPKWLNETLANLDFLPMPNRLNYYLLYGTSNLTPVSVTTNADQTETLRRIDGDGIVTAWSASGYHTLIADDGTAVRGPRIRSFGDTPPRAEIAINHKHSGLLNSDQAIQAICSILLSP